jgi:hypothetical protein
VTTQTLKLNTPIKRGDKEISEIVLHKPNVAAMRGISLYALINMNVDALLTVLPKISDPKLTEHDLNHLDLPDLLQAATVVAGFFVTVEEDQEAA